MAKLSSKTRNKLPASSFALPEKRAFPVNDKVHARLAKSGASRAKNVGNITAAEEARIDAKADKMLGKPKKANPNHEAHAYDWRKR